LKKFVQEEFSDDIELLSVVKQWCGGHVKELYRTGLTFISKKSGKVSHI